MKKKKNLSRIILWSIIASAILAAIVYAAQPQPILVDTAVVDRGPLRLSVDEDGVTRIREKYVISTPLTGRLQRITLDVGDTVIADKTIVANMEPTDPSLLDPRAVAQAKARVSAAERKLDSAKADLAKANASLKFAETEMGRARQLRKNNAASESEFAEKELLYQQSAEDARAAGFAVDIAEYELELEKAALLLTDPDSSDSASMGLPIKAPINGRVLRVHQESTTVVTAGSPLMEIGDPTDLEVVADVLSRDAVRISSGDPVSLEHWGGDAPLRGRVRLVEPSGFTKLSALGVEEQRVNTIIDLVDPADARASLGDNFRVDCRIVIWKADDVLRVPTSALFRVGDGWAVFTNQNGTAKEVAVTVDHNNGRTAEVSSGLNEGDEVILHPGDTIADGVAIQSRR